MDHYDNYFDMSNIKMYSIKCPSCNSEFDIVLDERKNLKVNYCPICGDDISSHLPAAEDLNIVGEIITEDDKDF